MYSPLSRTYPSQYNQRGGEGTYTYLVGSAYISFDFSCEIGRFPLYFKGSATLSISVEGLLRPSFTHLQRTPLSTLDPYLDQVVLLLSNTDEDENLVVRDRSLKQHRLTPYKYEVGLPYPEYSTSTYKFPPSSLYFSYDILDVDDSDDFAFGTGNFTIDFHFNYDSTGYGIVFCSTIFLELDQVGNYLPDHRFLVQLLSSQSLKILVDNTEILRIPTSSYSFSVWNHAAIVRDGNTLKIFINGNQAGSVDVTGQSIGYSDHNMIGGFHYKEGNTSFSQRSYIHDFRITKGIARTPVTDTPAISPTESTICIGALGRLGNSYSITPVNLSLTLYDPLVGVLQEITPATFTFTPIHPSLQRTVKKTHTATYASYSQIVHHVSYRSEIVCEAHQVIWSFQGLATHAATYLSASPTFSNAIHESSWSSIGGAEQVYTIHESSWFSSDPTLQVYNLHTSTWESIPNIYATHSSIYKSIVAVYQIHDARWQTQGENYQSHTVRYRSVVTTPTIIDGTIYVRV